MDKDSGGVVGVVGDATNVGGLGRGVREEG